MRLIILAAIVLTGCLCSFTTAAGKIGKCFLSFSGSGGLTAGQADRLPETAEKVRQVKTNKGEVPVTTIDGYRILYHNGKNVPFVNLKVELSDPRAYPADTVNLVENLKYLNAASPGMETKELMERTVNGFKVYGLSRNSIEKGSTLGIFMLFPGNDITVYFYFNNLKPEYRNFESLEDYKRQRDLFMDEYTKYLASCQKE